MIVAKLRWRKSGDLIIVLSSVLAVGILFCTYCTVAYDGLSGFVDACGHCGMRMRVDETGRHMLSVCINNQRSSRWIEGVPDFHNFPTCYQ